MNLLVYGAGQNFARYLEYTPQEFRENIVAVADADTNKQGTVIDDYNIISPEEIKNYSFDKVWISISNTAIVNEIKQKIFSRYRFTEAAYLNIYPLILSNEDSAGRTDAPRKIFDCFTFFNELEILDLRLKLLNDVVDKFVLVEMNLTHKGNPKTYVFQDNLHRYEQYLKKIIHIKIDAQKTHPLKPIIHGKTDWTWENYQRNGIEHGLKDCAADDIVIVSDLDEIPDYRILRTIKDESTNSLRLQLIKEPICMKNSMYIGRLNLKAVNDWPGSVITLRRHMRSPQMLRDWRDMFPMIKGGWHFTSMGSDERVRTKANSTADGQPIEDGLERRRKGQCLTGNCHTKQVNIDDENIPFTDYLKQNYASWFYKADM